MKGSKVVLRKRKNSDEKDILRWLNMEEWQYLDDPSIKFEPICLEKFSIKDDTRFFGDNIEENSWHIETLLGVHIGFVKYFIADDTAIMVEIGICIPNPYYWDKGYGKEAIKLLTDYLFREKEFDTVTLSTWEGNKRAQALYQKLGFIKVESDGTIWDIVEKEFRESMLYSLSRQDFYEKIREKWKMN